MVNEIEDTSPSYDVISLHKEIDLIQSCISRMAKNSFLIKGWSITLITIALTIFSKERGIFYVVLLLMLPTLVFWGLDAYYLRLERIYRNIYEWVLKNRIQGNCDKLYDLNPRHFTKEIKIDRWINVVFSITLCPFYGCVCGFLLVYGMISAYFCA